MQSVTETTFARRVLRAELPALVCFGLRACPGRRAMLPALEELAAAHRGRLHIVSALLDRAPLLAEQYGITASPTLLVFEGGEPRSRVVGFIADGLLRMLADEAAGDALAGGALWSPVEERFEDVVLIPLIERWGFGYGRQVACSIGGGARRGRVDLLLYAPRSDQPLTLIESKRLIRGDQDLRAAAAQAGGYARSLGLPSFVVAAPRGMWVYRRSGERAGCVRQISSLELQQAPDPPRELLLQLGQAG